MNFTNRALIDETDSSGGKSHYQSETTSSGPDESREINSMSCQSGKPCGRGKFCDNHYGKCERVKRRGDFCREDNHCQRKHECVFGRCRKEVPKGQEGGRCSEDADCPEENCCARQHGEFICKPRLRRFSNCFVPAGGLDYSLNEQCPCEDGFVCQYEMPVRTTTPTSGTRGAKNEWFQFTADTALMRCQPII
ncbi:hypothetical protein BV898_14956 [Hypsibius exemplaris]|uniref:Dickkopf N-terminal cysteine-rich domain-containing protein n=1 Tax=Hypsibius exemplaris TaxID=2072580 RepID=A0A9X6NJA1_HYPEX|nr:hypothetical protein BV898_14956 [Hypsibius exemplaris]